MDRVRTYTIRLLAAFSAALLALVLVTAFVINSGTFDKLAKDRIETLFNEEYRGRLSLGEVRLSFPDQVTIISPAVFEENAPVPALSAGKIRAQFNFLSLLKPELTTLSFQELEADHFNGRIVVEGDGKLNLQKIFAKRDPNKPKTVDIETFRCRKISIRNSSLLFAPLNAPRYDFRNLNADISRFLIGKKELTGTVERLRLTMPERNFRLVKASGMIALSPKRSEVIGLDLETEKSSARLSASFDGLDIFSGISFEKISKSQSFVHVESVKLHTDDLKLIKGLPELPAGTYSLRGDAKGTLADLRIMPSVFEHDGSHVAFHGEALNISTPKSLSFKVQVDKSRLSSYLLGQIAGNERLKRLAKESGGIDFSGLLQGKLDEWLADFSFRTAIGSGSAAVKARKSGEDKYAASGTFSLEKTEPHRLFGLEKTSSGFSGSGSFTGTVSTARTIEAAISGQAIPFIFRPDF